MRPWAWEQDRGMASLCVEPVAWANSLPAMGLGFPNLGKEGLDQRIILVLRVFRGGGLQV